MVPPSPFRAVAVSARYGATSLVSLWHSSSPHAAPAQQMVTETKDATQEQDEDFAGSVRSGRRSRISSARSSTICRK